MNNNPTRKPIVSVTYYGAVEIVAARIASWAGRSPFNRAQLEGIQNPLAVFQMMGHEPFQDLKPTPAMLVMALDWALWQISIHGVADGEHIQERPS